MTGADLFRRYHELRADFARRFPAAIVAKGQGKGKRIPLAIGVHLELADRAPDICADDRALFLRLYTKGHRYKAAVKAGCARVDLDGREVVPLQRMVGADRLSP